MITLQDIKARLYSYSSPDGANVAMGKWRMSGIFLMFDSQYITTLQFIPQTIMNWYLVIQPKISESGVDTLANLSNYDAANYLLKYYNEQTKSSVIIRDLLGE